MSCVCILSHRTCWVDIWRSCRDVMCLWLVTQNLLSGYLTVMSWCHVFVSCHTEPVEWISAAQVQEWLRLAEVVGRFHQFLSVLLQIPSGRTTLCFLPTVYLIFSTWLLPVELHLWLSMINWNSHTLAKRFLVIFELEILHLMCILGRCVGFPAE